MGSEADIKAGDTLRWKRLAVLNLGWRIGMTIGHDRWTEIVDELIAEVRKETLRDSIS